MLLFGGIYAIAHYETFNNFLVQKLYRTDEDAQLRQFNTSKFGSEEGDSPLLTEGACSCFTKIMLEY